MSEEPVDPGRERSEPVPDEKVDEVVNPTEQTGAAEQAEAQEEAEQAEDVEQAEHAEASAEPEDVEEDEREQAVDEEVYKLKSHRRKATSQEPAERKELRRTRKPVEEKDTKPATAEAPLAEEQQLSAEQRARKELEARLDASLAPASRRFKKLAGDDLEMMQDEAIAHLRDAMREAALADVECIRQGTPAVNKVRMLPEVVAMLQKSALADSILDGNLLESVRIWLEPLPDASLPSFEIQKAMFGALITLPIKTIHLRESGLGRVVLFYQRSKRPHPSIKRAAQKLIGDWTRPIIGRSDNYRDKRVATASFDPQEDSAWRQSAAAGSQGPSSRSSYEESADRRGRAAIPSAAGVSYLVAPVASVEDGEGVGMSKDAQLRRMKTKLQASRSRGRKSQVSVEGKDLN